ncbi:uncharacterized protein LOC124276029 [Haliotis rubra]|uniref:uncharacterized protein LOC124276029 n=1 Tax=Haliotis rubra TaxID=36100 RepID=UPI001EE5052E|nr:uncharacterized protein LOC124276029 [Haliotis rubra]
MNSRLIVYTFLALKTVSYTLGDCSLSCTHGCCGSIRYGLHCCLDPSISVSYPPGIIAAIVCAVLFPIILVFGIACCRVYCCGSSPKKHHHMIHRRPPSGDKHRFFNRNR